jgi:hypothetical protein
VLWYRKTGALENLENNALEAGGSNVKLDVDADKGCMLYALSDFGRQVLGSWENPQRGSCSTTLWPLIPKMAYGGARMSSGSVLGGNSRR